MTTTPEFRGPGGAVAPGHRLESGPLAPGSVVAPSQPLPGVQVFYAGPPGGVRFDLSAKDTEDGLAACKKAWTDAITAATKELIVCLEEAKKMGSDKMVGGEDGLKKKKECIEAYKKKMDAAAEAYGLNIKYFSGHPLDR